MSTTSPLMSSPIPSSAPNAPDGQDPSAPKKPKRRTKYSSSTVACEKIVYNPAAYRHLKSVKAITSELLGANLSSSLVIRRALEVYNRTLKASDQCALEAEAQVLRWNTSKSRAKWVR